MLIASALLFGLPVCLFLLDFVSCVVFLDIFVLASRFLLVLVS